MKMSLAIEVQPTPSRMNSVNLEPLKNLEWVEEWISKEYVPNAFDFALARRIERESTRCTRSVLTALGVPLPDAPQRPSFGSGTLDAVREGGYSLTRLLHPPHLTVSALYKDTPRMKKNLMVFTASHVFVIFACGITVDTASFEKRKPSARIESLWEFSKETSEQTNARLDRERAYKLRSSEMLAEIMKAGKF